MEIVIGCVMIIGLYFLVVMIRDGNRFIKVEYTVVNTKIKKEYTFVLLSDLHNKSYGKDNIKLIEAIDRIKPDSIMIAGDMLTAKPDKEFDVAANLVGKLGEKYPVYYGIGNHEYRLKLYPKTYGSKWKDYWEVLKKQGVEPLINQGISLEEFGILVSGVEIEREYYQRFEKEKMKDDYLESLLGKAEKEKFQILLAHNPDYFENYKKWGADLVLSGHIHGGIMKIPFLGGVISPSFCIFPKYDGGLFSENDASMVLSRGLGMHTLPIRIWNPGELIVVHLKNHK